MGFYTENFDLRFEDPFRRVETLLANVAGDRVLRRQSNTLFGALIRDSGSVTLPTHLRDDPGKLSIPELPGGRPALCPVEGVLASLARPPPPSGGLNGPPNHARERGVGLNAADEFTARGGPRSPSRLAELGSGGFEEPNCQTDGTLALDSELLLRSLKTLLFGFGSAVFAYDSLTFQFGIDLSPAVVNQTSKASGSAPFEPKSLVSALRRFASFGGLRRVLSLVSARYREPPQAYGVVGASFGTALASYLRAVDAVTLSAFSGVAPGLNLGALLLVWDRLQASFEALLALDSFFRTSSVLGTAAKEVGGPHPYLGLPGGAALIDRLYRFIGRHMTYPLSLPLRVFYNLYAQACSPYLTWVADALCIPHKSRGCAFSCRLAPRDDPFGEFCLAGGRSDPHFPESLLDFGLVRRMADSVFALGILRVHSPRHPFFLEPPPSSPFLALHFSDEALQSSTDTWKAHCARMSEAIAGFWTGDPVQNPLNSYPYACQGYPAKVGLPSEGGPTGDRFSDPPISSLVGCADGNMLAMHQLIGTGEAFQPGLGCGPASECLFELGMMVEACVKRKVADQCRLIDLAVHRHLVNGGGLGEHLDLIQGFLLLSYGPFVTAIAPHLADALRLDTDVAAETILGRLNAALDGAVAGHDLRRTLPIAKLFEFNYEPRAGGDFFAGLTLAFSPIPPVDHVIDGGMLSAYNEMFRMLAKLRAIGALLARRRPTKSASRTACSAYLAVSLFIANLGSYTHDSLARAGHQSIRAAFTCDPFEDPTLARSEVGGIPFRLHAQRQAVGWMLRFALRDATFWVAEKFLATCLESALEITSLLLPDDGHAPAQETLPHALAKFEDHKASLAAELEHVHRNLTRVSGGPDLGLGNPLPLLISLLT